MSNEQATDTQPTTRRRIKNELYEQVKSMPNREASAILRVANIDHEAHRDTPLDRYLVWDDARAGNLYREHQIRDLLKAMLLGEQLKAERDAPSVLVTSEDLGPLRRAMTHTPGHAPDGTTWPGYVPRQQMLDNNDQRIRHFGYLVSQVKTIVKEMCDIPEAQAFRVLLVEALATLKPS